LMLSLAHLLLEARHAIQLGGQHVLREGWDMRSKQAATKNESKN